MIRASLKGLERTLEDITRRMDAGAAKGMERAAKLVADEARTHHAFQNRTGDLQASIAAAPVQGRARDGNLTGGVVATEDYAAYVEARVPFLYPAWLAAQDQANAALAASLDAAFNGVR